MTRTSKINLKSLFAALPKQQVVHIHDIGDEDVWFMGTVEKANGIEWEYLMRCQVMVISASDDILKVGVKDA